MLTHTRRHDHTFERLSNPRGVSGKAGYPYFVNGLGERLPVSMGGGHTPAWPLAGIWGQLVLRTFGEPASGPRGAAGPRGNVNQKPGTGAGACQRRNAPGFLLLAELPS